MRVFALYAKTPHKNEAPFPEPHLKVIFVNS